MNSLKKIFKVNTLRRKLKEYRRKKLKIAFTNGCFDILHYGHVKYLESAKRPDRLLVVGLNSDASVRRIKGPLRPINNQDQRAAVLAALACVDYVTIFKEDTPLVLIKLIEPDILIKGADWKGKEIVGSDFVRHRGGKIELIRYIPQFSTTKMVKKINQRD